MKATLGYFSAMLHALITQVPFVTAAGVSIPGVDVTESGHVHASVEHSGTGCGKYAQAGE
jgi:hypothetical protein